MKSQLEAWSLDFVHDHLASGPKIRLLTVIDILTPKYLAIEEGHRLRGENVADILNRLVRFKGAPKDLFTDNDAEFTGHIVDLWAYHHKVRMLRHLS
jgi:putative transposase